MEKPAATQYPIHEILKRRWSPRAFSDRLIEPQKIRCLFEAARWAASSFNEQPWSFLVATRDNTAEFEKMLSCLTPGNQAWAKFAPLLILTASRRTFTKNDKPNRVYIHDVGLAAANLTFQATAMGLFVHQMAGIEIDAVRQVYQLPEGYDPVTAIAVGYAGDIGELPSELRAAEQAQRTRKALSEMVFTGKWGQSSPVVKDNGAG
jgi:nitroreductase